MADQFSEGLAETDDPDTQAQFRERIEHFTQLAVKYQAILSENDKLIIANQTLAGTNEEVTKTNISKPKSKFSEADKQYDLNKDGVIDDDELRYKNAVENLKRKKMEEGWDSTWFNTQMAKIPKPSKGDDTSKRYW